MYRIALEEAARQELQRRVRQHGLAPRTRDRLEMVRLSDAGWSVARIVLDNASVHHGKAVRRRLDAWQERGLFVFYLPPYSPHLNIAEVLWRKLKYNKN